MANYPVSVITDGMGLNITVMSYSGHMDFGIVADRDQMPDLWRLMDWLDDELGAARGGVARPAGLKPRGGVRAPWGPPQLAPTSSWARSAQSQRIGRVSRGSMISSTPNRSAVRNGERTAFSRASISARSATGSSAASSSRR